MEDHDTAFKNRMAEIAKEEKRIFGTPPIWYVNMLFEYGADETARRLIRRTEPSSSFWKLLQGGHPELTVESVILHEFPNRPWVTDVDLATCRERLAIPPNKDRTPTSRGAN